MRASIWAAKVRISLLKAFEALSCCGIFSTFARRRANLIEATLNGANLSLAILYEAKLITYPRTDSRHLGSDMRAKVPAILGDLRPLKREEIGRLANSE